MTLHASSPGARKATPGPRRIVVQGFGTSAECAGRWAGPGLSMPILYLSDDQRRLITVTMTEPYSVNDILSAIDRQASEGHWDYAILYDQRGLTHGVDRD